jgi:hypothetical protein
MLLSEILIYTYRTFLNLNYLHRISSELFLGQLNICCLTSIRALVASKTNGKKKNRNASRLAHLWPSILSKYIANFSKK